MYIFTVYVIIIQVNPIKSYEIPIKIDDVPIFSHSNCHFSDAPGKSGHLRILSQHRHRTAERPGAPPGERTDIMYKACCVLYVRNIVPYFIQIAYIVILTYIVIESLYTQSYSLYSYIVSQLYVCISISYNIYIYIYPCVCVNTDYQWVVDGLLMDYNGLLIDLLLMDYSNDYSNGFHRIEEGNINHLVSKSCDLKGTDMGFIWNYMVGIQHTWLAQAIS